MTSIDPRQIVAAKRDGQTLAPADIQAFIEGYTEGEISDALAAAFLMAALIRGLDEDETLALTKAKIASGATISFAGLDRPTVDKHSTGGVADGVTLVFAPVAAAAGLAVAKLSGRGLGHTGGTLDKLESIPGLRTDLTPDEIQAQVARIGCAVAAQSTLVVPADGALYALRDATATVPSIPLIAASVMSKKLAVLTDLILLDVKAGSGAFMKTPEEAEATRARLPGAGAGARAAGPSRRDGHVPAAGGRDRQRDRHRGGRGGAAGDARRPTARAGRPVRRGGARRHHPDRPPGRRGARARAAWTTGARWSGSG